MEAAQAAPRGTARLVIGGVLGGAAGLVAGALVGHATLDRDCANRDRCEADFGAIIGGAAGEAFLLPLGVHLANGRHGSYGAALLGSLGTLALGGAGMYLANNHIAADGALYVVVASIPVVQLGTAVALERVTARRRRVR
jgi:hypothetical protein